MSEREAVMYTAIVQHKSAHLGEQLIGIELLARVRSRLFVIPLYE